MIVRRSDSAGSNLGFPKRLVDFGKHLHRIFVYALFSLHGKFIKKQVQFRLSPFPYISSVIRTPHSSSSPKG